jgi:hypothetical protein
LVIEQFDVKHHPVCTIDDDGYCYLLSVGPHVSQVTSHDSNLPPYMVQPGLPQLSGRFSCCLNIAVNRGVIHTVAKGRQEILHPAVANPQGVEQNGVTLQPVALLCAAHTMWIDPMGATAGKTPPPVNHHVVDRGVPQRSLAVKLMVLEELTLAVVVGTDSRRQHDGWFDRWNPCS